MKLYTSEKIFNSVLSVPYKLTNFIFNLIKNILFGFTVREAVISVHI